MRLSIMSTTVAAYQRYRAAYEAFMAATTENPGRAQKESEELERAALALSYHISADIDFAIKYPEAAEVLP